MVDRIALGCSGLFLTYLGPYLFTEGRPGKFAREGARKTEEKGDGGGRWIDESAKRNSIQSRTSLSLDFAGRGSGKINRGNKKDK